MVSNLFGGIPPFFKFLTCPEVIKLNEPVFPVLLNHRRCHLQGHAYLMCFISVILFFLCVGVAMEGIYQYLGHTRAHHPNLKKRA